MRRLFGSAAIGGLFLATGLQAASHDIPKGTVVLPPDVSAFGPAIWVKDKSSASIEVVPVLDGPFEKALRLDVTQPSPQSWQIGAAASTVAPVSKGDVLWVTLRARSLESREPTGEAFADLVFMLKNDSGKEVRPLERRFTCDSEWTETSIPFLVSNDAAAGAAKLVIRFGGAVQRFEVGGITVVNLGPNAELGKLPRKGGRYVGHAPDAPWRAAAAERIERLRKGDLPIRVVDKGGVPVANAKVEVRMRRHAFHWGAAIDARRLVVGDSPEDRQYREVIEKHFSKVVFTNDLKWNRWINQKPAQRENIIKALEWLKVRDIPVRGHVMVWPSWQYTPPFLRNLENNPSALRDAVSMHIKNQTSTYPHSFADWDVVNETYAHNDIIKILGSDVVVDWFKLARDGAPNTKLFYNDFTMFQGSTPSSPSQHFYDLVKHLREKGAPIGGIGEQGHFIGTPPGPTEILAALDRFAKLGLPIQITEFDISAPDEELQADFTRDFITAAFSHPAVEAVVHWEFWENPEGNPIACLWRKDGTLRPNGQAWVDLVSKKWWTNVDLKTRADGTCRTRGFYGDYEVTISHAGRLHPAKIKLQPGSAIQTITLPF